MLTYELSERCAFRLEQEYVSNLVAVLFGRLHYSVQDCFTLPPTSAQRLKFVRLVDKQYAACSFDFCFNESKMLLMNALAAAIMFSTVNISNDPTLSIPCILNFACKPLQQGYQVVQIVSWPHAHSAFE